MNIQDSVVPEEISLKVERLIALAREAGIIRLSAEEGMGEDEAISVIEHYSELVSKKSLPSKYTDRLR